MLCDKSVTLAEPLLLLNMVDIGMFLLHQLNFCKIYVLGNVRLYFYTGKISHFSSTHNRVNNTDSL